MGRRRDSARGQRAVVPHRQVRSMVGTLVEVGTGRWSVGQFKAAFDAADRSRCGPVAPPHGLYLVRVDYAGA